MTSTIWVSWWIFIVRKVSDLRMGTVRSRWEPYQDNKELGETQESGFSPKTSESSALLQSFGHFPCNENPTRTLNTTSLKCTCHQLTLLRGGEKIHACVWRFKVASCKRASLKFTRFSRKKRSDTFLAMKTRREH